MQYSNAQVVWCQEEPKNMGAWRYVKPRMDTAMRELVKSQEGSIPPPRIRYVGRPAAASPGMYLLPQTANELLLPTEHSLSRQ